MQLIIVTSDIYFIVLPNPASASIAFQSFSGIFIRGALVYLIVRPDILIINDRISDGMWTEIAGSVPDAHHRPGEPQSHA